MVCSSRATDTNCWGRDCGRWAGVADAAECGGRQWAAQGAARLPSVVNDVQEYAVDPDPDPLTGKGHANADLPAPDADPAAGVDHPVDLDGGSPWFGLRQRRRSGGCTALGQEAGQVAAGRWTQSPTWRRPRLRVALVVRWAVARPAGESAGPPSDDPQRRGGGTGRQGRRLRCPGGVGRSCIRRRTGPPRPGLLQGGEHPPVQTFTLQALVKPLDLAGGCRGAGFGISGHDAVLPADPLEQHFTGAGLGEPAGELLAVVRQDFTRHPERVRAAAKAAQMALPVARRTTVAITQ